MILHGLLRASKQNLAVAPAEARSCASASPIVG